MQDRAAPETFIKSSSYTSPQYIKRLKFIFSAICHYAQSKNKSIEDLEILEFGCATGGITFPLTTLGSHVTALDIDSSAVSAISERIQKENLNNVIVTQAAGILCLKRNKLDVITKTDNNERGLELGQHGGGRGSWAGTGSNYIARP